MSDITILGIGSEKEEPVGRAINPFLGPIAGLCDQYNTNQCNTLRDISVITYCKSFHYNCVFNCEVKKRIRDKDY